MSKPKHPKRAPPRFRRVVPGQVWFVQRANSDATVTHPVLTAAVEEVTPETIVVRWLDDCAIRPKPDALPLRFARADFKFLELVA